MVPKIKLKIPGSNGSNSSASVQRKMLELLNINTFGFRLNLNIHFIFCFSVIKPIIKNKFPSEFIDESDKLSKEKSPVERVKLSTVKSKSHSKEKLSTATSPSVPLIPKEEIESVTEPLPKPSKSKKTTVVPLSTVVDFNIPATTSGNASVSSSVTNSVASSNKHKVKTTKKSKKIITQPHPAFYFVSTHTNVAIYYDFHHAKYYIIFFFSFINNKCISYIVCVNSNIINYPCILIKCCCTNTN